MQNNTDSWALNWQNPRLELRKINMYVGRNNGLDQGHGVFAQSLIKKGEVIALFGGYMIPLSQFERLSSNLQEYCYQIHEDFLFGPVSEKDVSLSEHFNHSCNPNVGFKDAITLIAMRDIEPNEEIVMDYATCMSSDILDLDCACKAEDCRGKVTGDDWKIPALQQKYASYFQPYIKELISG